MSKLTTVAVRAAKPREKPYKLSDGAGMYLEVLPSGGRSWRLKYRIHGVEKRISFGTFPAVSLKDARTRALDAKKLLSEGVDPSAARQEEKQKAAVDGGNTFGKLAEEWFRKNRSRWGDGHASRVRKWIDRDLHALEHRPIRGLKASDIRVVLERIEERGAFDTVKRVNQVASQVFRFAVARGATDVDVAYRLHEGLTQPVRKNQASIIDSSTDRTADVARLLRSIDSYKGNFIVETALKLMPHVFVRSGELRHMEWGDVDLKKKLWTIPAPKEKNRRDQLVPLSDVSASLIEGMRPFSGMAKYVFHNHRSTSRPMSDNAMLGALRSMGYSKEQQSVHGFRAIARSLIAEELDIRPDIIELQLGHRVRESHGDA
ncbi:MAG: tyrosine-type recombinase/integrase, partial [Pseudomonadales bacterium]